MKRILVLGANGMLGSSVIEILSGDAENLSVVGTLRSHENVLNSNILFFDAQQESVSEFFEVNHNFDYVINCIGFIPQKSEGNPRLDSEKMIRLNAVLPHLLSAEAIHHNFKIIQIATDCVYSGLNGPYSEVSAHTAEDIYGLSKSVGEVIAENMMQIRCSIIGRNDVQNVSLHNWFVNQPLGSTVNGYINHLWNGITTDAFAKVIRGVINADLFQSGLHHLIPSDWVSKFELLETIRIGASRQDIQVVEFSSPESVDRRLSTLNPDFNNQMWQSGGYREIPKIRELVQQMYSHSE